MAQVEVTESFPDGTVKVSYYDYDDNKEIIRQIRENEAKIQEREQMLSDLPDFLDGQSITNEDLFDAVTELGDLAAENSVNSEDLMDAITELADLVAQLLEGEQNGKDLCA